MGVGAATRRALAGFGYVVLGLLAAAGVVLSCAFLAISTDLGRGLIVPPALRAADDAIAGSIQLQGFRLLGQGGLELLGAKVIDPDGDVVLALRRARVYPDLGRIRSKVIGLRIELDGPEVVLKREEDGGLSLARAFAPTHPSPKTQTSSTTWTFRLVRLTLRGGSVRYVPGDGGPGYAASGLDADARALYAPDRAGGELSLRGELTEPERAPLALELAGGLRGKVVRLRQLRLAVGDTALEAVAQLDQATWRGRAAVLSLAVDAAEVRRLAPRAPLAGDLTGTLYAESDGSEATAALDLRPRGGGAARAAAAVQLPPAALAGGAEVHLDDLDLSRVLRGAPATSLRLQARGRARGRDLASLQAALALSLAPSRVRAGRLGPVELRASAAGGAYDLSRLDATLPGAALTGSGRWRPKGALAGHLALDARDLALLRRNLQDLLGRPLPPLSGAVAVDADLSGTEAAPSVQLRARAPSIGAGGVSAAGVALTASTSGALSSPRVQLDGRADRLVAGRLDARALAVRGQVERLAGELAVTASVPLVGPDPLALRATGALSPDRRVLTLSALSLAWPGDRFELAAPARVTLAGPSVDRLALAAGSQRIELAGGLSGPPARRALDARLHLAALDLAHLPRALLPPRLALAGRLDADAEAKGSPAEPAVTAQVRLADGALLGMEGLTARADLGYDGARRRARLDLAAQRAAGGALEVRGELPVALARAGSREPLDLHLAVRDFPLGEALRLARVEPPEPVAGALGLEARLGGTAGAPTAEATAALERASYGALDGVAVRLALRGAGRETHLTATADARATRAAEVEASLPLDWARLLRAPGEVARGLAAAPLTAQAAVPGYDLSLLAGRLGVPKELRGRLAARLTVKGTARAPRGDGTVDLTGGTVAGYPDVEAHLAAVAAADATRLEGRGALEREEVLRFTASLALPVERLGDAAAREAAAVRARLDLPRSDLRRAGAPVPLTGHLEGWAELAGSLAAPRLAADVKGHGIAIDERPLGDVALTAQGGGGALHAGVALAVASGGTLTGALDAQADLGLPALRRGELARAPARATLRARALDLGFLPAVAPRLVRAAAGKLEADVTAEGPLARMVPRGTASLKDGSAAVVEFGDWTGIALDASLSDDVFRLDRLTAHRGHGRVELKAEAVGLARKGAPADLTGSLEASELTISRAGQDFATLTASATLTGKLAAGDLDAELRIPRALVKLPEKLPTRKIQPLDQRPDIAVGPFHAKAPRGGVVAAAGPPFHAKVHLLVPNRFQIKGDSPRVDVELRADVVAEEDEGDLYLTGTVETLRGQVEPVGGRSFDLKRARVQFTGEDYKAGVLDVQAVYVNPNATATVTITGTVEKPEVKLTSDPPMDEGQIALLIATGRTEFKAGAGGVQNPVQEAGNAALGALSQQVFKDLIADKLPVDTVSLDSSQLRAGKYLTDKIYVGYTRRFNARTEENENTNEVRAEYQISRRWTFDVRYGDAGTGGGSLIWSKDY
ncbi:hypothetical protein AMYX_33460 [Anaeromyxobacter diazotrophicus]|uniref:Translocation and assembly module TamB C-terminal domain-containing protein n=1 Tax=Anaeromyxobacter diazotrophicus TaxID=2590199 RepID=A0A7I9VQC8_9BACT|nr:hypothetical protein AMYX_33460 [Anaeromyxobacter diazotrophicus]